MDKEKIDYILNYFSEYMNSDEMEAWKHWSSEYKVLNSNLSKEHKDTRMKIMRERGWLSSNKKTLALLDHGIDNFREQTATRILSQHPKVLDFNYCPKCNKLARTPFAKQCKYCYYDWH